MEPNCIKIVNYSNGVLTSSHSKNSLGRYFRTYELNKPTYPEEKTLLFCHELDDKKLDYFKSIYNENDYFYLAHATDKQEFFKNHYFCFLPTESTIKDFWNNKADQDTSNFPEIASFRLASSITLLERIQ